MIDEAEELLIRMGAPTCVFCGRIQRTHVNAFIRCTRTGAYDAPCSVTCLRTIQLSNIKHLEEENEKERRRTEAERQRMEADLETYKMQLRATYYPSSKEYRQAQHDYADDLEYAYRVMGNFRPSRD